jgi:tetratricopeptide (TPR) repeat protein
MVALLFLFLGLSLSDEDSANEYTQEDLEETPDKLIAAENHLSLGEFWDAYVLLARVRSNDDARKCSNRFYQLYSESAFGIAHYPEVVVFTNVLLSRPLAPDERSAAFLLRAKALSQLGDFLSAQEAAQEAGDPVLLRELLQLEERRSKAEQSAADGHLDEAVRIYDQLLVRFPASPSLQYARANLSWIRHEYDLYFKLAMKLSWVYPRDGQLFYRRGVAALCQMHFTAAQKAFWPARGMEGVAGDAAAAHSAVTDIRLLCRALNPEYKPLRRQLRGKLEQLRIVAEGYCIDGTRLIDHVFLRDLQLMDVEKELTKKKLEVVAQYIERSPQFAQLYLWRGKLYLSEGDYGRAIPDFQNAGRCGEQLEAGEQLRAAMRMRDQATRDYL